MKYDSSMTQFHEDIVSAIKSMIHGDVDKVAELAAEGSPVPLRDYLRERHGRSCHGGNKFDCMSSAFFVKFDHMINNLGDTKLQLSWSQTAGFIRKYPSEFFSEDESTDEILPDKNSLELLCNTFDESKIECPFWHTGQTMRYVNIGGVDFKCDYCDCSFCEFDKLTEFLASHCHDYEECLYYRKHKDDKSDFPCEDCGHDKHGCCDYPDTPDDYCVCGDKKIPAPAQTEAAAPAVFDYSELDADTAAKLENVTAEIFNVRKEYIFTMAKKVAYAHDLLANHYGGKFGAWCESIGITRKTGNNLIHVVKLLDNSTLEEQENLNKLSDGNIKLLYEAARPSAPPELVEQVKSGDITTHKEYIALKKQLEEAEEHNAVLSAEKEQFHRASKANLEKLNEERDRNAALERQLKELESRPRDVAVDTEELNRRLTEASAKLQRQAAEQVAEERRDFADKLNRMEEERDRLESRIAELESSENSTEQKDKEIAKLKEQIEHLSNKKIKVFAVKLTVEEFERLMDIAKKSGDTIISNAVSTAQIIRI